MAGKTKTTRKKTTKKASAKKEVVKVVQRERIKNGSITSTMTKMSVDPFRVNGTNTNASMIRVDFASEEGRRGKEVRGLISGPKSTSISNVTVARKRSRYAALTSPYAKRGIDVIVSNVVGTGQKLQANSPDTEFNKEIEDLWMDWTEEIDPEGKLNMAAFEALAFRSMLEGGDCFIRFRTRRPEDGLSVPLQLQLHEAEQVPTLKNEKNGNNTIIAGIEFTPFGMVTRYHMYPDHPGEFTTFQNLPNTAETVPVDAKQVIHLHDVRRPSEVRGLPILSQSLVQINDVDDYMAAELVRKKCAALIGGFITYQPGMENFNPFITDQVDGEGIDEEEEGVHIESLEPGTFPVLPLGYDVKFSEPADVGINFGEFMKQQLMMMAASLNILYEQLTGDYGSRAGSDRTVRAAMLEFKRIAINYQKNIISFQLYRRVYREFIRLAVLSGALVLPEGMTLRQAQRANWVPDPWEFLNPLQEVNTQIKQIRSGLKTRSEIITEMGKVPAVVDQQFREEKDREKDLNLVFDTNAELVSAAGVVQSSDPETNFLDPEDQESEEQSQPEEEEDATEE